CGDLRQRCKPFKRLTVKLANPVQTWVFAPGQVDDHCQHLVRAKARRWRAAARSSAPAAPPPTRRTSDIATSATTNPSCILPPRSRRLDREFLGFGGEILNSRRKRYSASGKRRASVGL